MDIDFIISFGIFLVLLSVVLGLYFGFQATSVQLAKTVELREEVVDFLTSLITKKGSPEDWERQDLIEELGLASEIFRRQVLISENSGYTRINEPVSIFLDDIDDNCIKNTSKNSKRVYDQDEELPLKVSNKTYCLGNHLKSALITFLVNLTANQEKVLTIYYSSFNVSEKNYATYLQAWYKFDENFGTRVYDYSGNENNGDLKNGSNVCYGGDCPNWVEGKFGKGLRFDGINDYVDVGNSSSLNLGTGDFTITAWIKASQNQTSYPQILSKRRSSNDGFLFGLWNDGKLYMQIAGINLDRATGPDLRDNSWHFVVVTRNGSLVTYYIDGVKRGSTASSGNMNSTHPIFIGIDSVNFTDTAFNGTIDEIRIYSKALSEEEIQTLYNASPLSVRIFPEEKILAISPEKLEALKRRNYEYLRKEIGESFNFYIEISEIE